MSDSGEGSIFVVLGADRRRKLNELAKHEGRAASEIVRRLIDGYLVLNGMEPGAPIGTRARPMQPRRKRERRRELP